MTALADTSPLLLPQVAGLIAAVKVGPATFSSRTFFEKTQSLASLTKSSYSPAAREVKLEEDW